MNSRAAIILVLAVAAVQAAQAQDCSSFDPSCPNLVFSATMTIPTCPGSSIWDDATPGCWEPCSVQNTANVTYSEDGDDPLNCVPTCPAGTVAKPAANGKGVVCVQCPIGSSTISGKKGNWVCQRAGLTRLPLQSIALAYKDRTQVQGGCPAGSAFVNGVCATCTSCDTYLTAAPEGSARQYLFWQTEGTTFCVPDSCCLADSWMVENEGNGGEAFDENAIPSA